jgi:8-oxo-dGTP pyrophosphatase MutT (NUDIX family)
LRELCSGRGVGTKSGSRREKRNPALSLWQRLQEALFMPIAQRISRTEREWLHRTLRVGEATTHVAAVCYRVHDGEIEFLLVKTRAGRWTFPKGRVEDDATRAAAAAREAYEEAGVHGRVDPLPFATYLHSKAPHVRGAHAEFNVDAHLCEVHELVTPKESFRDPTWFSVAKTKRRLHEERRPHYGTELARVVDRAIEKIAQRRKQSLQ